MRTDKGAATAAFVCILFFCVSTSWTQQAGQLPLPKEGDYVAHDFHFKSGETLQELRIHYAAFGTPTRDARGRVTNAVLILHGTSGSGAQFLAPQFAGVLLGPGQLLDITHYYVILPDNIGYGKSSKPSDGMHAHFPRTITTTWSSSSTICSKKDSV
jgi:homoserine O-acetyltransferase